MTCRYVAVRRLELSSIMQGSYLPFSGRSNEGVRRQPEMGSMKHLWVGHISMEDLCMKLQRLAPFFFDFLKFCHSHTGLLCLSTYRP